MSKAVARAAWALALGMLAGCAPETGAPERPEPAPVVEQPVEQPPPEMTPRDLEDLPDVPRPEDVPERPESIAEMETAAARWINAIRREQGLDALEKDSRLAEVAREYSRLMAREGFFRHVDPEGRTVEDRLRAAGVEYRMAGENIFRSVNAPDPVELAVRGWMASPGHRRNLLRPGFTHTGVGVARDGETYYFTQVFTRPR